jgi:hypothetical protein
MSEVHSDNDAAEAVRAGSLRFRPLVRMRVKAELRAALKGAKRGKGPKAKALTQGEQNDLFQLIGNEEIDTAIQEAEGQAAASAEGDGRVGGPIIDFLTSEKFIQLVLSILLKFLGL